MQTRNTNDPTSPLRSLYLLYHELRPTLSEYSYVVQNAQFEEHLDLFASIRNSPQSELLPEITFDDGHISNFEYASPLLQARGIQAHFFITVGWTGHKPGYMDWPELRSLQQAGHRIGAHGWSHTLLTHCSSNDLQIELVDARQILEDKLGVAITTMSLPGGRFNPRVLAACQEAGYALIYTSIPKTESLPAGPTVGRLNVRGSMQSNWISSLFEPRSASLAGLEREYRMKAAAKNLLGDRLYAKLWSLLNRAEPDAVSGNTSDHENPAHH